MNTLVSNPEVPDNDSVVRVFFATKVAERQAKSLISSFGDEKHKRGELYARIVAVLFFCGLYALIR